METPPSGRVGVRFEAFELDLSTGELRSIEAPDPDNPESNHPGFNNKVLLREQVFQVLRMLLEREGKIVIREEIKGRLWPNDIVGISTKGSMQTSRPCAVPWGIPRTTLGISRP